jgi:hypothetical protein
MICLFFWCRVSTHDPGIISVTLAIVHPSDNKVNGIGLAGNIAGARECRYVRRVWCRFQSHSCHARTSLCADSSQEIANEVKRVMEWG